jgi:HNH endonuclease/NUMOD4 motif/NUMOD1 domain
MEEIWKPIKDFKNYSVSNLGNIRNEVSGKILKNNIKAGYENISLTNKNNKKSFKVHRLVALAFIDNPENKSDVNHKDKNKLNNCVSNLEWLTRKENNVHRCKDIIISAARYKSLFRIDKVTNEILEKYESIQSASEWAVNNSYGSNLHNTRNAIGNCITGLSKSACGFKWELDLEKELLDGEIWKPVPNTIKPYYVSNLGRFKNANGRIMENYTIPISGYMVCVIDNVSYRIHRVVAQTFIENPENKEQVNHIDGNKLNNAVSNLEWVTNQENQIHKVQMGLANCFTRKIGQYDLENNLIKEYPSIVSAAKEHNINKSCIQGVLSNKRKTTAGFIWKYLD